jgi:hypothetical protein
MVQEAVKKLFKTRSRASQEYQVYDGEIELTKQRGRSIDVDTVMINGEIILRDHRLTRIDSESLFKELRKSLTQPPLPREVEGRELGRQLESYLRRFYAGTMGRLPSPHYYYNARF